MNRKGSVASTFEIAFGVLIVMFIFISSIYFSQIGEVKSNADVVAVNSGFECYNNLNNILKTDKIFNEKTSIILGKSEDNGSNLMTIVNYFENLNSDFKLIITEDCDSFEDTCEYEESDIYEIKGNISGKEKVILCSAAISKQICEDEDCSKFIHMELYK